MERRPWTAQVSLVFTLVRFSVENHRLRGGALELDFGGCPLITDLLRKQ